jgi:hypothetical protein
LTLPVLNMDISAPNTPKARRCHTIFQTLKESLGDDAHLLEYLPKDVVVAHEHGGDAHIPFRIHVGTMREAQDGQTRVYVYMLKSSHLKELPDVRLRDRHSLGFMRQYRLETVLSRAKSIARSS